MSEMKVCTKCDGEKSVELFSWKTKRKRKSRSMCKDCHSAYRRQHYLDNKELYIDKARRWDEANKADHLRMLRQYVWDYLLEHPCLECGEPDPIVLEFDHVRGIKIDTISSMMGSVVSLKRLKDEIAKCEVRCANCHRRKTAKERGWHMLDLVAEYEADS